MTTYHADTGAHNYEFKADDDFSACDMFPDALVSRADGHEMDISRDEAIELQNRNE